MEKLRTFFIEILVSAVLVGLLVWKYPEVLWRDFSVLALLPFWHATWNLLKENQSLKSKAASVLAKRGRMSWVFAFVVGGIVSVLYLYGINAGLNALTAEEKKLEPKPPVEAPRPEPKPSPTEPPPDEPQQRPPATYTKRQPRKDVAKPAPPALDVSPSPDSETPRVEIQTAPVYGNLADRANGLANDLDWFVAHRENIYKTNPIYKAHTRDSDAEFIRSTDGEYHSMGLADRVLAAHKEFAELHFQDIRLDDLLKEDEELQRAKTEMPNATFGISLMEISEMAMYFRGLAAKLK